MNDINLLRQRLQQGLPSAPNSRLSPASETVAAPTGLSAKPSPTPSITPLEKPLSIERTTPPEVVQRAERLPSVSTPSVRSGASSPTNERAAVVAPAPQRLPLPYQDIKRIAEASGFVGMSDRAIEQAYRQGKSLMVDYRV